ncbi:FxsC protein [Dactylosporangium sp. NPDC005572]|uniref:FxsC protein n=1 Tax=Dactylosporangium sp. NPDC005572 TaxID=3156889 RepID=UPI0033A7E6EF
MAFVFLSYRPADDGDYAEALVHDLCDAIRLIDEPGNPTQVFLSSDAEIVDGDWSAEAAAALAECTAFVAVGSERYFLTDRCGREWWAFQDRLLQHEAETGRRPRALIPLAWGDARLPERLPADRFASDIGRAEDVRALARLTVNEARYREMIDRLARHVVETGRADPVRRAVTLLPYRATPNAFRKMGRDATGRSTPVPVAAPTPAVRFVVAAGRRDEMEPVRRDLEFYGAERADWRPYQPADGEALARRAQAVAADHLFYSEVVDDVEDIVDVLERADASDEIVVMLVDAWVVRITDYRAALEEVNRHHGPSTAVVVPFSADDPETQRARATLGDALARLLTLRRAWSDRMLRIGPETTEAFEDDLGEVLETARSAAFRSAKVRRVAPGSRARSLPLLDAP